MDKLAGPCRPFHFRVTKLNEMKKICMFLFVLFIAAAAWSQGIGIGTNTPAASSMLDITSTSKGILVPRMTTAQRTAIVSPAAGLLVYDNTTNSFWYYNGGAWTSISGSAVLPLPYFGTVASADTAFHIKNTGTSAAITGQAASNSGVAGISTGGNGVEGQSTTSNGVYGNSFSGNGVNALSYSGYGLIANSTTNSGIFAFSTNAQPSINATNSNGTGVAIKGASSNYHGILGTSGGINTAGVRGEASGASGVGVVGITTGASGYGVFGSADAGTGVYGFSTSGSGVKAFSANGTALEVIGNVKISGGSTAPADGAVLRSDASGNARWQNNNVAFREKGINSNYNGAANNVSTRVHWLTEDFDIGNNYFLHVGSNPGPGSSVFTVPVNGIYHFDVQLGFGTPDQSAIDIGRIELYRIRNGVETLVATGDGMSDPDFSNSMKCRLSTDLRLQAGDKIYVAVWVFGTPSGVVMYTDPYANVFNCHLVYAE